MFLSMWVKSCTKKSVGKIPFKLQSPELTSSCKFTLCETLHQSSKGSK